VAARTIVRKRGPEGPSPGDRLGCGISAALIGVSSREEQTIAATPPAVALGTSAPNFCLRAVDGRTYAFADVAGSKGTVIVFICNHCPYVKPVIDRMVADARTLLAEGTGFAVICSNDAKSYPEDSFGNMQRFAEQNAFTFPYLHDEDQSVARAYGGCVRRISSATTRREGLKYRGRLDEGRMSVPPVGARRELVEAMRAIAATGKAPEPQFASMGCSIKWKEA
jgi:peroxiredoxin